MGRDATASLSYGFIIPQPHVLKLLQKLRGDTEKITTFGWDHGAHDLTELLQKHLEERGMVDFEMVYLTAGEDRFKGLAMLHEGVDGERVTVWGFGSQKFEPLGCDMEEVGDADAAFKCLGEDSLFKELSIKAEPQWLLGCNMSQ